MDRTILDAGPWPATPSAATRGPSALAVFLVVASGACGLVWQMAWTAGLGIALGHEMPAVLGVLGAFFGGLALGAWMLAGPIERSTRPGLWYAACEAVAGGWGLAVTLLLPDVAAPLARWLGPQPGAALQGAVALLLPLWVLLPATVAMGATLPALERLLRAERGALPRLYAWNTAGALAGVLLTVFVAMPLAGVAASAGIAAALNAACALAAAAAWARVAVPATAAAPARSRLDRLAVRLAVTGLLGIGYEVLAVRVLAQVCENTVYTYALLLAVFLLGTAGGAALWRRLDVPAAGRAAWADRLLLALAVAVLVSGCALWSAERVRAWPADLLGAGVAPALAGEALAGAAALLAPSLAMGALFSLLCQQAGADGWPLGRAFALNTLGAALAPALVGAWLAPVLGARVVLVLLVLGYLALLSAQGWQRGIPAAWALAAVALAVFGPALRFVDVPEGGRVLSQRDGALAAVSVVADADGVARLTINNRVQEGSTAGGLVEMRLAQLPLLLHDHPRQALFLGLGTGYTAHAAAIDPRVRVQVAELLPEVVEASNLFMLRPTAPRATHPVEVVVADARRFVQAGTDRYDVVVADLFHPARSGAGSLYTVEHFRAVRERLAPGGLFCQWLALHQMDLPTLRSIVAAFVQVYPDGVAVLAGNSLDSPVVGLVARPDRPRWTLDAVQARMLAPTRDQAAAWKLARIDGADAVLGSVVADSAGLRRLAADARPNTDDRPVVAHRAARTGYAPEALPRERLAGLLHVLPAEPVAVLAPADPAAARLRAYWRARRRYLELGLRARPDPDPRAMLDAVGPELLQLVVDSPTFQPAAESLAALAQALQGSDYALSQNVLARLREAQAGAGASAVLPTPSPTHP